MARLRIGEMLVQQGRIDGVQLQSALAHQRRWGGKLGHAIVQLGFLPEQEMLESVGNQIGVPCVSLAAREIAPQVLRLVPARLIRSRKVLPIARLAEGRRGPLVVALADPADLGVLDEISFATGMDVRPALASERDIELAIARHLDGVAPAREGGFAGRMDAIDLPDDTSPLGGK